MLRISALTVAVALSLAACGGGSTAGPGSSGKGVSKDTIKIGFVDALTGPSASYGQPALAAASWVFDQVNAAGGINGRKLQIVKEDDQCTAENGVAAARKVEPDVAAVIGLTCSGSAVAVRDAVAKPKKLPIISLSGGGHSAQNSKDKDFVDSAYFLSSTYDQAVAMVNMAVNQLGAKRIAILHANDLYGQEGEQGIKDALQKFGMSLVANETVDGATVSDTSPQALKIRDARPDATLVFVYPTPGQAFLRQADELKVPGARVASASLVGPQLFQALPASALKQTYFSTVNRDVTGGPQLSGIADKIKAAYPKLSFNPLWGSGAAAAELMVHALGRVDGEVTREALIKAIDESGGFSATTLAGPMTISATDHNAAYGLMFFRADPSAKETRTQGYWSSELGSKAASESPAPTSPLSGYQG